MFGTNRTDANNYKIEILSRLNIKRERNIASKESKHKSFTSSQ